MTFDLHLRVLQGIDGVYLNEENCNNKGPDYLDSLQDHEKSSTFWLSYTDHRGQIANTDKKSWI